jgi:hypothetical protein
MKIAKIAKLERQHGIALSATLMAVALALGSACAAPQWTESVGLDVWDVPALQKTIEIETKGTLELNAEIEECQHRVELKERLIADLRAGRATLQEVTSAFLAVNRSQPSSMFLIRTSYSGATDEEKTARNVVAYAIHRTSESPSEEREVVARLSNQLQEYTGSSALELK